MGAYGYSSKVVALRVTPVEYAALKRAAKACGMSVSAYVRAKALPEPPPSRPRRSDWDPDPYKKRF